MTSVPADTIPVTRMPGTRIPTAEGVFQLYPYVGGRDKKEHIALVKGEVAGRDNVLVRLHSECFTGDVLHSRRCDCGDQLHKALRLLAGEESGILIYLRQEGRGIGLLEKLKAYNLQDIGFDTVEANLLLGFRPDERDYRVAAVILKDLGVASIRLLTNNPEKIESLRSHGVRVNARLPLVGNIYPENGSYLMTKARRMKHLFGGELAQVPRPAAAAEPQDRSRVTLCYAQSIDGCVTGRAGGPVALSGPESLAFVHRQRAAHEAILVGIGTVLSDNPRLTVRYAAGKHPLPVVLDTHLRIPPDSFLVKEHPRRPWIIAGENPDEERRRLLERTGARVIGLPQGSPGRLNLAALLRELLRLGVRTVMVEGGARIISSFIEHRLVDRMLVTISPVLLGGVPAYRRPTEGSAGGSGGLPRLKEVGVELLGSDIVLQGVPDWTAP